MSDSRQKQTRRAQTDTRGRRAESIAALFLQLKGYRIKERRFRCPAGEIDIIAKRGNTFIFIEVKARPNHDMAVAAVSPQQVRRIVSAAKFWLAAQNHSMDTPCRFDMVSVSAYLMPKHVANVFEDSPKF